MEKIWSKVLNELPKMVSDGTLLGFELMNEPNCGLVGHEHLGYIEASQQLRVSTTPTAFQTFKLGMGLPCEVDEYRISVTGPQKYGTKLVDPQGVRAWISAKEGSVVDSHYGWKRDPLWKLGECIFAQHNIWTYDNVDFKRLSTKNLQLRLDVSDKVCQLLQPNFFNQIHKIDPRPSNPDITKIDKEYFTNNQFIDFYLQHKEIIRKHEPSAFVLIQPPVLEIPPNIKSDPRNIIDKKTIYCPHYYDGMSLMFKTWNTKYNVDTLGIMRGKYLNPVLGIVFGEKAIRNCIRKQFLDIRHECISHLGNIPVLMSETGMPFDMNDKSAFETGKYHSQTAALDALSYAIEGSGISVTYWCYNSDNCHKWGDRWNNEDFSFWSPEDRNLDASLYNADGSTSRRLLLQQFKSQIKRTRKTPGTNYSRSGSAASSGSIVSTGSYGASGMVSSDSYKEDDDDVLTIQASSVISSTSSNVQFKHNQNCYPSPDGVRAVSAVVRPFVVATFGSVETTCFDLRSVTFSLNMVLPAGNGSNIPPTIIFVPKWHYPYLDLGDIYVTSGHVKYNETLEYLEWYHESQGTGSNQNSSLKSSTETIVIKNNSGSLEREESGIFPCPNNNCPVT